MLPGRDRTAVVVANRAKLVYEEVGDWLEGTGPVPRAVRDAPGLEEQILLQNEAAMRLRDRRTEQGALGLETIEARPVVVDGWVLDLVIQQQNPARCLIEEFMVAANGAMAWWHTRAGPASP